MARKSVEGQKFLGILNGEDGSSSHTSEQMDAFYNLDDEAQFIDQDLLTPLLVSGKLHLNGKMCDEVRLQLADLKGQVRTRTRQIEELYSKSTGGRENQISGAMIAGGFSPLVAGEASKWAERTDQSKIRGVETCLRVFVRHDSRKETLVAEYGMDGNLLETGRYRGELKGCVLICGGQVQNSSSRTRGFGVKDVLLLEEFAGYGAMEGCLEEVTPNLRVHSS